MEGQFFSQFGDDKWIVDNLHYPLSRVFVDVGASDGISGNNTYFLKRQAGKAYVKMLIPVTMHL